MLTDRHRRPDSAGGDAMGETSSKREEKLNTYSGYEGPMTDKQHSSNKADTDSCSVSLDERGRYDDDDDDDDDEAPVTEQQMETLMSGRTVKLDDEHLPMAETDSGLSVENIQKSSSKKDDEDADNYQAAFTNHDVDGLVSTPSLQPPCDFISHANMTSGYELRKFKSTPSKGLEAVYAATKRSISYGHHKEEKKRLMSYDDEEEEQEEEEVEEMTDTPYSMVEPKSFVKMGGKKTQMRGKRIEKSDGDDNIAFDPGNSSSTANIFISKKWVFAFMSACFLQSIGAYFVMMKHRIQISDNPAQDQDTSDIKSSLMVDSVDEVNSMKDELSFSTSPPSVLEVTPVVPMPVTHPPAPSCIAEGGKFFVIEITTDNAANETSWEIEVFGGGDWRPYSVNKPHDNNQMYKIRFCIQPGEYRFTIRDTGNNGLCCYHGKGRYAGYLRGSKIFESPEGDEAWGERVHTFTLESATDTTTTTTPGPTIGPTKSSSSLLPTTSLTSSTSSPLTTSFPPNLTSTSSPTISALSSLSTESSPPTTMSTSTRPTTSSSTTMLPSTSTPPTTSPTNFSSTSTLPTMSSSPTMLPSTSTSPTTSSSPTMLPSTSTLPTTPSSPTMLPSTSPEPTSPPPDSLGPSTAEETPSQTKPPSQSPSSPLPLPPPPTLTPTDPSLPTEDTVTKFFV